MAAITRVQRWTEPTRVEADAKVLPRAPVQFATAQGAWSNCDAYVVAPNAWGAVNAVSVELALIQGQARHVLATADLWTTPYTQSGDGRRTWLLASVRGHPCDGFELVGSSPGGLTVAGTGKAYLRCWGTESTPEALTTGLGETAMLRAGQLQVPRRLAHLAYRIDGSSPAAWREAVGDAFGRPYFVVIQEQLGLGGQGSSTARESQHVARDFGVKVRWALMSNTGVALRWFQMFDRGAAVGVGDACQWQVPVTVNGAEPLTFPGDGWQTTNGVVFGCSSTPDVFTPAADGWFSWICR